MPGFNITGSSGNNQPDHRLSSVKDTHRSHRWKVSYIVGNDLKDFYVYAKTIGLPDISIEHENILSGSLEYQFPKSVKWEDVTVSFYDVYGIYNVLTDMFGKMWTPETGMRPADEFMDDSIFELVDGYGNIVDRFTLINSWLKSISHGQLTYESNDIKLISITIAYTHAEYDKEQFEKYNSAQQQANEALGSLIDFAGSLFS